MKQGTLYIQDRSRETKVKTAIMVVLLAGLAAASLLLDSQIAILAVLKNQGYLVDICLIYAMISFLAVVVLSRIYTGVYREEKDRQKREEEQNDANA